MSNKIDFNSLSPEQKKVVLQKLKEKKEQEELNKLKEKEEKQITEINLQEPLLEEVKEQINIDCVEPELPESIQKHIEKKEEKHNNKIIVKDELTDVYNVKSKPFIGTTINKETDKKGKVNDESWETLIAFEQEFKKRSKEQEAETKKRALEEKRKLNKLLFSLVFGGVVFFILLSYLGLDNSDLFRNSEYFFSNK